MEGAGASFVLCEAAPGLGDDVDVLNRVVVRRLRRMEPHPAHLCSIPGSTPYSGRSARAPAVAGPALLPQAAASSGVPDRRPRTGPRRWEMFSLAPDAPRAAPERLVRAMRDCDRFIPGISSLRGRHQHRGTPSDRAGLGDHVPVGGCLRLHLHDPPVPPGRCSTASSCPTAPSASPPRTRSAPASSGTRSIVTTARALSWSGASCSSTSTTPPRGGGSGAGGGRRRPTTGGATRSWPRTPWPHAGSTARPTSAFRSRVVPPPDECFATAQQIRRASARRDRRRRGRSGVVAGATGRDRLRARVGLRQGGLGARRSSTVVVRHRTNAPCSMRTTSRGSMRWRLTPHEHRRSARRAGIIGAVADTLGNTIRIRGRGTQPPQPRPRAAAARS